MKSYNKVNIGLPVNDLILEIPPFMLLIFKGKKNVLEILNIFEQKEQMFIRCIEYKTSKVNIPLHNGRFYIGLHMVTQAQYQNCVSYKNKTQKFINIIIKCRLINKQHWHTLGWIYCILRIVDKLSVTLSDTFVSHDDDQKGPGLLPSNKIKPPGLLP